MRQVSKKPQLLHRYTSLSSAVHILENLRVTLLNPASWDDKNDAHYLQMYRQAIGADEVLALCFTRSGQTYHHWRIFAPGTEGVCIEFDRDRLISCIPDGPEFISGEISYLPVSKISSANITVANLPFLKRWQFKAEREFRIVSKKGNGNTSGSFEIDKSCIRKITLSPWIPKELSYSLVNLIKRIDGANDFPIVPSSIIYNEKWMRVATNLSHGY